jgi:DNA relaxase NicK
MYLDLLSGSSQDPFPCQSSFDQEEEGEHRAFLAESQARAHCQLAAQLFSHQFPLVPSSVEEAELVAGSRETLETAEGSPREVTRGESGGGDVGEGENSLSLRLDYLGLTFNSLVDARRALLEVQKHMALSKLGAIRIDLRSQGLNGYTKSWRITFEDSPSDVVGFLASGGCGGTAYFELKGSFWLRANRTIVRELYRFLSRVNVEAECLSGFRHITRLDLALDCFKGYVGGISVSPETFRERFRSDPSAFLTGGRPPRTSLAGDWDGTSGSRTYYVGNACRARGDARKSGGVKGLRVYDKGREQGFASSPWARVELQLRHRTRQVIPLEFLDPKSWLSVLSGAYPILKELLGSLVSSSLSIPIQPRTYESDFVRASQRRFGYMFRQWAPTLAEFASLLPEGLFDLCALLDRAIRTRMERSSPPPSVSERSSLSIPLWVGLCEVVNGEVRFA